MCPNENGCEECDQCPCYNCRELLDAVCECSICCEPFQNTQGICSCDTCGNLSCWNCARKIDACPYCRASPGDQSRNVAVEKLFKKLKFPCFPNSRDADRVQCPLAATCAWSGNTVQAMAQHLKQNHSLILLMGDRVTVEISALGKKVRDTENQLSKYVLLLSCYQAFFFCKIELYKRTLKIVFLEISNGNGAATSATNMSKFAAWLRVFNSAKKMMKGVVEIPNNSYCNKELDISCDKLIQHARTSAPNEENHLKILISIRPMQER